MEPWVWYAIQDVMVIKGEVADDTTLTLAGAGMRRQCNVTAGLVRWELHMPKENTNVRLTDGTGRVLAEWELTRKIPSNVPMKAPVLAAAQEGDHPETPPPLPSSPALKGEGPKATGRAMAPLGGMLEGRKKEQAVRASWPGAGKGLDFLRGPSGKKRVCLSFDAGSTSESALEILDALKARSIKSTFFLTGTFIERFPDLVRRIHSEGHEVGNHTYTHPQFSSRGKMDQVWTQERFEEELLKADRAFLNLVGRPMDPLWRAPYGEHNQQLRKWAELLGYRHIGWSEGADTLDWASPEDVKRYKTGEAILEHLHRRMKQKDGDGLIVLMHLGAERPDHERPSQKLGPFLDRIQKEGWKPVCVGDYLTDTRRNRWEPHLRLALIESLQ